MNMKKLFLLGLLFCISFSIMAQVEMIDSIVLSATELSYGIYADVESSSEKCIYFDMDTPDPEHAVKVKLSLGGISNVGKLDKFIFSLEKADVIYEKWAQNAHEESVRLFSKKIPVPLYGLNIMVYYNEEWRLVYNVRPQLYFYVDKGGRCFLILETDKFSLKETEERGVSNGIVFSPRYGIVFNTASNTISKERSFSGASISFSSTEEIDSFIGKLRRVASWKNDNNATGRLFK